MANSNRRYVDEKTGKMFIPMNVQGGLQDEQFITTPKIIALVSIGLLAFLLFAINTPSNLVSFILSFGVWFIISLYITRFVIFEEKYYSKMYKQLKKNEITKPSLFWQIVSIRETQNGALFTYVDGKVGILIRVDRSTITGKPNDFMGTHYDAISDFYKELMLLKYSMVQINIMEPAGNDPRLEELDKLISSSKNSNIKLLMEKQIGYIKNIAHNTLYEYDYFLIYTYDTLKMDTLIDDVVDVMYKLLDGAFLGFSILSIRDIIDLDKELFGVKYFDYVESIMNMFNENGINTKLPFTITNIIYTDGENKEIDSMGINTIRKMAMDVLNGTLNISDVSIKETLNTRNNKNKEANIDFDSLSEGFGDDFLDNLEFMENDDTVKRGKKK